MSIAEAVSALPGLTRRAILQASIASGLALGLSSHLGSLADASQPLVGETQGATLPKLSGSFIQPALVDSWTNTQLASEYTALKRAGITTQVLQWTADSAARTATYSTGMSGFRRSTKTEVPDRVLAKAEAAGIKVHLGLQVSSDWWTKYASDPTWLDAQATLANALADELWTNYGPYDSFGGWYIPFEVDNLNFPTATEWGRVTSFLQKITQHLHAISKLPVVVSPFYNATLGAPALTPSEWQQMWTTILTGAQIDIIALQDGVGAGHATADQIGAWFAATRAAITAARPSALLYDDAETFVLGLNGLEPMPLSQVVTDLVAAQPYSDSFWSFSYDHYQAPLATNTIVYDATYRDYLSNGRVETTPPTTPQSLSVRALDSQSAVLTWTGSSDNIGVAGYRVYRNGLAVGSTSGTTNSFSDTQLAGSASYEYSVSAYDGAGNLSPRCNPVTVTLPPAPQYSCNWALGKPYTASTAASPSWPDANGTSLTDGVRGTASYSSAWQGRNGVNSYSFTIDLGQVRPINAIETGWLQVRGDYVFLPASVVYAVSNDAATFTTVATISQPPVDATNQVKNYRAIGLVTSGRYVRITVSGGTAWTMVDEASVLAS